MAKQSHTPSRRAMLAGLAAAPVAGLPGVAEAIERHKAAHLAYANAPDVEEIIAALSDDQWQTLKELATTPCVSELEFVEKLKYLFAFEQINEGCPPDIMSYRYGSVLVALNELFGDSPPEEAQS